MLEQSLKIGHVVVAKALKFALRQQTTIDNTGVVPSIRDDPVPAPSQRADRCQVGYITAAVGNRIRATGKVSDFLFHLGMQVQRATQNAYTMRTGAIFFCRRLGGSHDTRVL